MPDWFPNPELEWERRAELTTLAPEEVEKRLGRVPGAIEVLSGGHANLTARIGDDAILRIYRRDPTLIAKELLLLRRPWSTFRVPAVLASGEDFLLLERVRHRRLESTAAHGAAAGSALAEIHATTFAEPGLLGPALEVIEPFGDFLDALRRHTAEQIDAAAERLAPELGRRILATLDEHAPRLRERLGPPVLDHGDFKASNVHWAEGNRLLVLDWEFAFAGSALMDIGQLFRWGTPPDFTRAFARAYTDGGGTLLDAWERDLPILDLANLAGLLSRSAPGSRRARDLLGLLERLR